ncbi:MAG: hypothetical protein NZM25_02510 [Leptospiraceae bacterium]|nr:hypothetical protein [Leptospiraceae bacterium]MDW8307140.1 trigger factor [Leptospiraceae bacterium]
MAQHCVYLTDLPVSQELLGLFFSLLLTVYPKIIYRLGENGHKAASSLMADISTSKVNETLYRAQVKIRKDEAQELRQNALDRIRQVVELPGFRKGKVPNHLLEQRFGHEIHHELLHLALDKVFHEINAKQERKIYKIRQLEKVDLKEDEYTLSFTYDTLPFVKLGKLKHAYVRQNEYFPSQEELERLLTGIRRDYARYVPRGENEPIGSTDRLTVEYETLVNGVPISSVEKQRFSLSEKNLPPFLEELRKTILSKEHYKGNEVLIELTNQQGSEPISVIFTILEAEKEELPELNEDFVKTYLPEIGTLDQLKENLQKSQKKIFDEISRQYEAQQALLRLKSESELYIPQVVLEDEIEELLDIQTKKIKWEDLDAENQTKIKKSLTEQIEQNLVLRQLLLSLDTKKHDVSTHFSKILEKRGDLPENLQKDYQALLAAYLRGDFERIPRFFFQLPDRMRSAVWELIYELLYEEGYTKKGEKLTLSQMLAKVKKQE